MIIDRKEIIAEQKRLSPGIYVAAIIAMMSIQWMTLDMYLPALPVLKEEFHTTEAILNFSLNSDLVFASIGTLIGGTLSDKYGRNPIMIAGLVMAAVTMFLSAAAQGVVVLTVMRGVTGFGGGVSLAVATAVIRDSFRGRTFRTITTITQATAIIGPVLSPAIGAMLIEHLSWRWIFIALGLGTVITMIPFLLAAETWPKEKRQVESVMQATIQSFNIARNGNFMAMMALMMLISIPMWAYLGTCSYIYYDFFHVSNMQYSLLYASGTLCAFAAPFMYIWLSARIKGRFIVDIILAMLVIATIFIISIGSRGPVLFLVSMVPVLMAEAIIRPMALVIVLEEYPDEAGSASAVSGFLGMIVGSVGTAVATLEWGSFINGILIISVACVGLSLMLWLGMTRKKVYARQLGFHQPSCLSGTSGRRRS